MNRVVFAAASLATAIVVGGFALRRSAEDVKDGDLRAQIDMPGLCAAKKTPTTNLPAVVVSDREPTLATEAGGTQSRPLGETDEEPVDFERLAATVPLEQIPSALARLSDDGAGQNLRAELLRRWASAHPADAAQWAAALPEGDLRRNGLTAVAAEWASQDLPAARHWAENLDATGRDTVMMTLVTEAASANPLGALELALQIQEATPRANAVAFAVAQWAANDPQAARDWTEQVADAKIRQHLDRLVTPVIAESDPATAADYIASRSREAPDSSQAQTAVEIAQRWMQQSPEAAARWVETFRDPGLRAFAVDAVMRIWAETDSATAHQWLSRQPASEFRDEATFAYAAAVAPADGVTAADLALTIQDPVRREQLIAQIVSLDTRPTPSPD